MRHPRRSSESCATSNLLQVVDDSTGVIEGCIISSSSASQDESDNSLVTTSLASSCSSDSSSSSSSQEEEYDYDYNMRLDLRLSILSLKNRDDTCWQDLEDDLFIILHGRVDHLMEFEKLYIMGIEQSSLLQSLAYLCSRPNSSSSSNNNGIRSSSRRNNNNNDDVKSSIENYLEQHITVIASYFASSSATTTPKTSTMGARRPRRPSSSSFQHQHHQRKRECNKLAVLRTLMRCLAPGSWQSKDVMVEKTLSFLTQRHYSEWEFLENHSEAVLLWEIRAKCLFLIDKQRQQVANRVAKSGDSAAIMISTSAKLIETGLVRGAVPVVSSRLESAGKTVKRYYVKADDYPLMMNRDAVVAMVYSDAAKRASETAREGTRLAVGCIRNVTNTGFQFVAKKFEGHHHHDESSSLLPPEGAAVLKAAGRVGIATVGAVVIIGEAVYQTTFAVIRKTADVSVDVVRHKYGESAGQVVSDAGEIARNILGALGDVALLSEGGGDIASSTTKQMGKTHVNGEYVRAKDSMKLIEMSAIGMIKKQSLQHQQGGVAIAAAADESNSWSSNNNGDKLPALPESAYTTNEEEKEESLTIDLSDGGELIVFHVPEDESSNIVQADDQRAGSVEKGCDALPKFEDDTIMAESVTTRKVSKIFISGGGSFHENQEDTKSIIHEASMLLLVRDNPHHLVHTLSSQRTLSTSRETDEGDDDDDDSASSLSSVNSLLYIQHDEPMSLSGVDGRHLANLTV